MIAQTLPIHIFSDEPNEAGRYRLVHELAGQVDSIRGDDRARMASWDLHEMGACVFMYDNLPRLAEELTSRIREEGVPISGVLLLPDPDTQGQAFRNRLASNGLHDIADEQILDDRAALSFLFSSLAGRLQQLEYMGQFRTLIEHTQDVITVVDAEGMIQYESPTLVSVLGYQPEELIGTNPFHLIHEEDRPALLTLFEETRQHIGQAREASYRFKHADGHWVFLESRAKVFEFSDGKTGIIISSRDISDRISAMEQVRQSEHQLEEAQQLTHMGSWRWNKDTNALEWSDEMYRIYGFEPGSPLSMERFREAIHPDDRNDVAETIAQAADRGHPFTMRHRIIRGDGSIRTIEGRGEVRKDEEQGHVLMVGTGRDITEQVVSRQVIDSSEKRFRTLFESSPDGILVLDNDGIIQDANRSATEIFGASREELAGQHLASLWSSQDPLLPDVSRSMLKGEIRRLTRKVGNGNPTQDIEMTVGHLEDQAERRTTLFLRDITERVESEDLLRRLGRRQQEALEHERKRISREVHDVLGQALTALKMETDWAANHLEDGKTEERLNDIADHINETIETARRIAHELRPGILDDFGLGAAVEWYAKRTAERSGLTIRIGTVEHPELPDELQLAVFRICQELLTNVLRHAEASEINITIASVGSNLMLSVRDDGRGMPSGKDQEDSSLGMLGIRERLGPWKGRLEVESPPAGGTRVEVLIPLNNHNDWSTP